MRTCILNRRTGEIIDADDCEVSWVPEDIQDVKTWFKENQNKVDVQEVTRVYGYYMQAV